MKTLVIIAALSFAGCITRGDPHACHEMPVGTELVCSPAGGGTMVCTKRPHMVTLYGNCGRATDQDKTPPNKPAADLVDAEGA